MKFKKGDICIMPYRDVCVADESGELLHNDDERLRFKSVDEMPKADRVFSGEELIWELKNYKNPLVAFLELINKLMKTDGSLWEKRSPDIYTLCRLAKKWYYVELCYKQIAMIFDIETEEIRFLTGTLVTGGDKNDTTH